jgi:hypothetical protein
MNKESRSLALRAAGATCIAVLFVYSWRQTEWTAYSISDRRQVVVTVLLGAALLSYLVSLFLRIRGKS